MTHWARDQTNRLVRVVPEPTVEMALAAQGARERPLRELFYPISVNPPSCIVLPETTATNFEIKHHILNNLPIYHGLDREDPYLHIKDFLEICRTFKFESFSTESMHLLLFPFSLKDKAKTWLNSLPSNSITTWEMLCQKNLSKFFPMSKKNSLRREISDFCQEENEKFYEGWERFKDLLAKCPHHGFEKWRLVQYFYNGLTHTNRVFVETMKNGTFLNMNPTEAYQFFEDLSENSQQWDFTNHKDRSSQPKKGALFEVSDETDIKARLDFLIREVKSLSLNKGVGQAGNAKQEKCDFCGSLMHDTSMCPSYPLVTDCSPEQGNAMGKSFGNTYSNNFIPNGQNHPNFSWKPNNFAGTQFQQPQQRPALEDTLSQFMQVMRNSNQAILHEMRNVTQVHSNSIAKLETQVGQLATQMAERERGTFPSQPISNPKGQYAIQGTSSSNGEQVQSITTLRSGKQIDNHVVEPVRGGEKDKVSSSKDKNGSDEDNVTLEADLSSPKAT